MADARGISTVPDGLSEDLADFLRQMRLRLIDIQAGRVAALLGGTGGTSGTTAPAPAPGPPGPPGPPAVDIPDPTPPPSVSGVIVTAGLDFVFIETDAPTFTEGSGYNRTLVYGAKYVGDGVTPPLPTFGDAVLVHEFVGQVGSFTSEPATQWHIWVKWRTNDGVISVNPAGGANGYQVTTGVDVSMLLTALAGSITESELYGALNTRINLIDDPDGVVGSVNHRIKTETTAREALASDVTTLQSTVADNSAAISTEAITRANVDGHLSASYTVRTQITQDGQTVVGGFGITGTSSGTAGPTIDFGVIADRFWIGAPSSAPGATVIQPFIVQATPTTINGVAVPVGVYMNAAYIANGTITDAKIGIAAITSAKIQSLSATKITAGTIAVGEYIQSSDYVNGASGWRIGGNIAEFGSTSIRGLLTAGQIDTRNLTIKDGLNNVIFSAGQNLAYSRVDNGPPADATNNATYNQATTPVGTEGDIWNKTQVIGNVTTVVATYIYVSGAWRETARPSARCYYATSATSWNDGLATAALAAIGISVARIGDIVTAYNTAAKWSETHILVDNFSIGWGLVTAYFSGNVVMDGTLSANKIITGSLTGQTITGGTLQTSGPGGQRIELSDVTNEARFYGDPDGGGSGPVELLASIGITTEGADSVIGNFGSSTSIHVAVRGESTYRPGVFGLSATGIGGQFQSTSNYGVYGQSSSASGVYGNSVNSYGVQGISQNSYGVYGSSWTSHGGRFDGNSTKSALFLTPISSLPSDRTVGGVCVLLTSDGFIAHLCYADGTNWRYVSSGGVVVGYG